MRQYQIYPFSLSNFNNKFKRRKDDNDTCINATSNREAASIYFNRHRSGRGVLIAVVGDGARVNNNGFAISRFVAVWKCGYARQPEEVNIETAINNI